MHQVDYGFPDVVDSTSRPILVPLCPSQVSSSMTSVSIIKCDVSDGKVQPIFTPSSSVPS